VSGAAAGAEPVAGARGGLAADDLRAEIDAIARAASSRCRSLPDRRCRRGHADGCICTRGSGSATRGDALAAALVPVIDPAFREHRRTAPRSCSRGVRARCPIVSDTRSLWRGRRLLEARHERSLPSGRNPRRRGSVLNELARASSVAMIVREGTSRLARGGGARRFSDRPDVCGNEGKMVAFVAPSGRGGAQALRAVRL